MMILSRRTFTKFPLLGVASRFCDARNSTIHGVLIGAQSYSFRDRSLQEAIAAMQDIGLSEVELWQGHVEPKFPNSVRREELRKWRTTVSLEIFKEIRRQFEQAGIGIYAYNYSFRDEFTDAEIEVGFEMAKALGAKAITASSTVSVTRRVAPVAAERRMMVGMHGHDNLDDPNEFARPASFEAAMNESKWIGLNLDIGYFLGSGYDPVEFLRRYHSRTVTLHIKDRKQNRGPSMPFGQGDTPIRAILTLLKEQRWDIPANIEYSYKGSDTVTEVKKCYDYCKDILNS